MVYSIDSTHLNYGHTFPMQFMNRILTVLLMFNSTEFQNSLTKFSLQHIVG